MAATSARIERRVFLSHAAPDKPDIQRLREALADRGVLAHEDVLELRLGDTRDAQKAAIAGADGFILLLTPAAISDADVHAEIAWALETKLARPEYAILPILRGLGPAALRSWFGASPPRSITLTPDAPIESAVAAIVQALGLAPQDATPRADPLPAPPMAELVIELDEPHFHDEAGTPRAAANARVEYLPPAGARVARGRRLDFIAPLGRLEADDLHWYLEAYPLWPFGVFAERAKGIESNLQVWGKKLFDAVLGREESRSAVEDWRKARGVAHRITVRVDDRGGDDDATRAARRAAAATLLALPWELLADDAGYLFEGALKARVRRALPSEHALDPIEPSLPLRVLLVLARPDEGAAFLDLRASAIPLAEALDPLGEAVELTALQDGTFKALRDALDAAERAKKPFHVVHFDGHGMYDARTGLGKLCFENASDAAEGKLDRRMDLINASELGALLRERRIALFVLEACQTAKTDTNPTASVAAAVLQAGVASVVAMSHAVRVDTTRRFVEVFYRALANGERVGAAMVSAQLALKEERDRGEIQATKFELSDWMVPVLFQEETDARLFPGGIDLRGAAIEDRKLKARVQQGELPAPPAHGFVGRAKALLTIDRMLRDRRWVAITGGGGLGKTELAKEAARWRLAMRRAHRIAFVSVEAIGDMRGVLDAIGRQLVPGYAVSVAEGTGSDEEKRNKALLPVKGELARRKVLIVVDNLESVLPQPGEVVQEEATEILAMIRELCEVGETRVILTSRESAPAPLAGNIVVLPALRTHEATAVIANVLRAKGREPLKAEEDKEGMKKLVDAVGGHARSLVQLGELVMEKGVKAVTEDVHGMMRELETRYPEQRERSLIASVQLSLRRLPGGARQKIRALAVFPGVAQVEVMAHVLQVPPDEALDLCRKLIAVGLASASGPYLLLDPALGAALAGELTEPERDAATARWLQATAGLVVFLYKQQNQEAMVARHGTRVALIELMGALAKLEQEVSAGRANAERVMDYVTNLESLVSTLGIPRVLERVGRARKSLSKQLTEWSHARFNAEYMEVIRRNERGERQGALDAARVLRDLAEAPDNVFPEAAYDRALAWLSFGRMLGKAGQAREALDVIDVARSRFAELAERGERDATTMENKGLADRGDALLVLTRLDEAALAYETCIQRARTLGDLRAIASVSAQLGSLRFYQDRFDEALAAHTEALATFELLGEPRVVAIAWHQIGMVHARTGNFTTAENAYKESLKLKAAHGDRQGEAATLHQLASLYDDQGRLEDATTLYRQALEITRSLDNKLNESHTLNDLGIVLGKLRRFDEARESLVTSLALKALHGHAAVSWKTWGALEDVERGCERPEAASDARRQALLTYRAYRLDGGEPMDHPTRVIVSFREALRTSDPAAVRALLLEVTRLPEWFAPAANVLHAIAEGSRDPAVTEDPALEATLAVELALLLESLPPADPTSPPPPALP
jgi:tetratricopeptide (TPR) repeat protein